MDRISPKKYANYERKSKFKAETKKRFKSNIQKLCNDKCLKDLKKIVQFKSENKNEPSYKKYHYKCLSKYFY